MTNYVTSSSKSPTQASSSGCTCSRGGGCGNRSVSLGLTSLHGLSVEEELDGCGAS